MEIVIVDDEKIEAEGNKRRIFRMELPEISSIKTFSSSLEALEYLKQVKKETIVIVDINMPVFSGLTLIEELRELHWIKFIVLSAYDDFKFAQKSMFYGVKYYLLKPCAYEELKVALKNTLSELETEVQGNMRNRKDISMEFVQERQGVIGYHQSISWALSYIDDHISERLNLAVIANQMNMNYSYFSQLFKSETGYTFSEYVNKRKMQLAGELLLSDTSVAEISKRLGFESMKGFFCAFKKYYKTSPVNWKKQQMR